MRLTEMSASGFRTVVAEFRRPTGGIRWVVIPTIHMAHPDYYWAIWQRLRSAQAVIAEQYDGPSSTGLAYANAMRLARQRASRDLVHQDIDYGALGVPVIFPDAVPGLAAGPDRRMPDEHRISAHVETPFLAWEMYRGGDDWLTGVDLTFHDHTVVDRDPATEERDDLLIGVIREIDTEFAAEDMEVAIVFGAAHTPLVVRELTGNLGHRLLPGTRWLTAIDYDEAPYLRRPPLDGWMDF
ncbi:hypothetical protein [Actinoplanes couchii]|uniref:SMODS-associated and fused to various effectors domain-containing protein n=1 Tax=Actinoplanes couchii TaxID=403638 RepID=A0ABQ3XCN5_9ACTN|nr:hypothetical protein [Actinoplanes couchii]MDR6321168.1 hypothetical protein [Actinoplanes couchii]GID56276.1 hypothetical protein Aco03nite_046800 [Actinoplanes couchii]